MEDGADGRGTWHTHTCLNRMSNMKLLLAILSSLSLCIYMHMPMVWTNDVAKSASGSVLLCIPRYPPMLAFSTAPPPNPQLPSGALAFHYSLEHFTQQPHCSGKAPITNCLCSLTPGLFSRSSNASSLRPFLTIPPNPSLLWTSPAISAFLAILGD